MKPVDGMMKYLSKNEVSKIPSYMLKTVELNSPGEEIIGAHAGDESWHIYTSRRIYTLNVER